MVHGWGLKERRVERPRLGKKETKKGKKKKGRDTEKYRRPGLTSKASRGKTLCPPFFVSSFSLSLSLSLSSSIRFPQRERRKKRRNAGREIERGWWAPVVDIIETRSERTHELRRETRETKTRVSRVLWAEREREETRTWAENEGRKGDENWKREFREKERTRERERERERETRNENTREWDKRDENVTFMSQTQRNREKGRERQETKTRLSQTEDQEIKKETARDREREREREREKRDG